MNTFGILGMGFVAVFAVACSSAAEPGDDDESPVADTPLTGTFGGTTFTAVSATAHKGFADDDSEKRIEIYDTEVTCATGGNGRSLITSAKWQNGFEAGFGLQQNATFHTPPGENDVATRGRIEVIDAPATGQGTVRLRAFLDDDNQVEGEITVEVCEDHF